MAQLDQTFHTFYTHIKLITTSVQTYCKNTYVYHWWHNWFKHFIHFAFTSNWLRQLCKPIVKVLTYIIDSTIGSNISTIEQTYCKSPGGDPPPLTGFLEMYFRGGTWLVIFFSRLVIFLLGLVIFFSDIAELVIFIHAEFWFDLVIFLSELVIFESWMVIFVSELVIFVSQLVIFASQLVIFASQLVIFASQLVIFGR